MAQRPTRRQISYRVAAGLLFLFSAGHTVGALSGRSPAPEADAVLEAMRRVHFQFNGADRTFDRIFFGHTLLVDIYLVACALLAWRLARVGAADWPSFAGLAWVLAAAQALTAIIAWTCFFAGPGVLTTAATLLLIVGNVGTQAEHRRPTPSGRERAMPAGNFPQ